VSAWVSLVPAATDEDAFPKGSGAVSGRVPRAAGVGKSTRENTATPASSPAKVILDFAAFVPAGSAGDVLLAGFTERTTLTAGAAGADSLAGGVESCAAQMAAKLTGFREDELARPEKLKAEAEVEVTLLVIAGSMAEVTVVVRAGAKAHSAFMHLVHQSENRE